VLFWNASDLERKLADFRQYYNFHRVHTALDGITPSEMSRKNISHCADLSQFQWKSHCRGYISYLLLPDYQFAIHRDEWLSAACELPLDLGKKDV
jgi:hypothetical protein